jgi:hypothetical protein
VVGRYNVLVVLTAATQLELMRLVNSKIESCRGVSQVDVRIIAQTVKHDIHEVVVRPTLESAKSSSKRRS